MPQLVAISGTRPFQPWKLPARIGSAPAEPPRKEMPGGVRNVAAGPKETYELMTLYAPEPEGGSIVEPGVQPAVIGVVVWASGPRFCPAMATFAKGEISPNTGARKEVPHAPRMVRSSNGDQLKAIFG